MARIHVPANVTVTTHSDVQSPAAGGGEAILPGTAGLHAAAGGCAGGWAKAIGLINAPAHQNTLVIRGNWSDVSAAYQKGKQCRPDLVSVDLYDSPVLVCAPYIAC